MKRRLVTTSVFLFVMLNGITAGPVFASSGLHLSDVAQAKAALLVKSDFPSGWTTSSSNGGTSGSPSTPGVAKMASCLGDSAKEVDYNPPSADSPEFDEHSDDLSVNDTVEVLPNAKIGLSQFDIFNSPWSPTCLEQFFNGKAERAVLARSAGPGVKFGTITAVRERKPNVNNMAVAIKIEFPFVEKGTKLTVSLTAVTIMSRSMTVGAELTCVSVLSPFPTSVINHLEAVTAERLNR